MKTHVGSVSSLVPIMALSFCYDVSVQARNLVSMTHKKLNAPFTKSMVNGPTLQRDESEGFYLSCACNALKENHKDEAIDYYVKALGLNASNTDTLFSLGNLYFEENALKSAILYYNKFLELNNSPLVHYNLGICYKKLDELDKALEQFQLTIGLNPDYAKAYMQSALVLAAQGGKENALEMMIRAATMDDKDPVIMHELGCMYRDGDQLDKAVDALRRAYQLDPHSTPYKLELANILTAMGQYGQALEFYFELLEKNPKLTSALYNIGYILRCQGRVADAIHVFKKVLEIDSNDPLSCFSLGLSYLTLGEFESGWPYYEWRWKADREEPLTIGSSPLWDGSPLQEKTLLLICEQGFGDTFQFIRYAKIAKSMGARVIVCAQKPLKTFLQRCCPYIDEVVVSGDTVPTCDYQIPLMSMPMVLKTTLKNVPVDIPYVMADKLLVDLWSNRLNKNFKIGICWEGNAGYNKQVLRTAVYAKSTELKNFASLCSIKGCSFYSLQKINGIDQLKGPDAGFNVIHFDSEMDEDHGRFMDTAAIIANLDLVITVDTSVGHLAAALGKPVWILLPMPADWRWMLDRSDSPWYPNVKLFRQRTEGCWATVFEQVAQELKEMVGKRYESDDFQEPYQETSEGEGQAMPNITNLAQFFDDLTIKAIKMDASLDIDELQAIVSAQPQLQERYFSYLKIHPELKNCALCLFACNRLLYDLEKKLISATPLILGPTIEVISDKISHINSFKQVIKNHINQFPLIKE